MASDCTHPLFDHPDGPLQWEGVQTLYEHCAGNCMSRLTPNPQCPHVWPLKVGIYRLRDNDARFYVQADAFCPIADEDRAAHDQHNLEEWIGRGLFCVSFGQEVDRVHPTRDAAWAALAGHAKRRNLLTNRDASRQIADLQQRIAKIEAEEQATAGLRTALAALLTDHNPEPNDG